MNKRILLQKARTVQDIVNATTGNESQLVRLKAFYENGFMSRKEYNVARDSALLARRNNGI